MRWLGGTPASISDLHERLTRSEQGGHARPGGTNERLEVLGRRIAGGYPEYLRRRTIPLQERDEVAVLGEDDGATLASGHEDGAISGVLQSQIPHRRGFDTKLGHEPGGQTGRELGVDPDNHAARIG